MSNSPFIEYQGMKFLRVPNAEDVVKEVVIDDCYELRSLTAPGYLIDGGALYGEASVMAYKMGIRPIAIEPSENSFQVLQMNMLLNGMKPNQDCGVMAFSLSDSESVVTHHYREDHPGGSGVGVAIGAREEYVQGKKLSSIVREIWNSASGKGIQVPIYVKLDIEGAESLVFKDAEEWLPKVDFVAMETHDHDADKFAEILERHGFDVKITGTGPSPRVPWDKSMAGGLVIARKSAHANSQVAG